MPILVVTIGSRITLKTTLITLKLTKIASKVGLLHSIMSIRKLDLFDAYV